MRYFLLIFLCMFFAFESDAAAAQPDTSRTGLRRFLASSSDSQTEPQPENIKEWSVRELIHYALNNSPSLIQSELDVKIAEQDRKLATRDHKFGIESEANILSGVSFGQRGLVSGGAVVMEELSEDSTYLEPFLTVNFKYPLFRDGKFVFQDSTSEKIAEVDYKQSKKNYKLTKQELMVSVSDLYLQAALKKEELDALRQNVGRLENILEESRERYRRRLMTKAEFLEAELVLIDAKSEVRVSEVDLEVLKQQLANVVGMPSDDQPIELKEGVEVFEEMNSAIPELNALKSIADNKSPELSIADLDVEESELNLRLVKSQIFPILSLITVSTFSTRDDVHFLGGGLSFPLDALFHRIAGDPEVEKSRLKLEKSRANLQATRDLVRVELIDAYGELKKANELAEAASEKVEVSEARVEEAGSRLEERLITTGQYLEFLNLYEEALVDYQEKKREAYLAGLNLLSKAGIVDEFFLSGEAEL